MRLAGKTAIITGAGSGIGRATAQKYADQGAFVICAGLSKKSNDDTLKLIISKGGQGSSRELDVTDSQMIEKFFSDIFENYKQEGLKMGFKVVESGPLVRSSYHADEHAHQYIT